jgi:ribonuclease VapC
VIVVDSSALIAILFGEPETQLFSSIIASSDGAYISTVAVLEAAIVADRSNNPRAGQEFDAPIASLSLTTEAANLEQVAIAREANRRFGKGNHPARLNFGDCFAYALAKHRNASLLYKGADFVQTDIVAAIPPA